MPKPANVAKSTLLNKVSKLTKGAYKTVRDSAPKIKGGGGFPNNLTGLVARLTSWKMDEDKNGNPYFAFTFIGCSPEEIKGKRASKMHFIKDSPAGSKFPKSAESRLEECLSDIKLMGGETEGTELEDLPTILNNLVETKPYIEINTWAPAATKANPSPQVNYFIQGIADYTPDEQDETVEQETESQDQDSNLQDSESTNADGTDQESQGSEFSAIQVGEVYYYKGNADKAASEHEVLAIDTKKEELKLKQLSTKKIRTGVKWTDLE